MKTARIGSISHGTLRTDTPPAPCRAFPRPQRRTEKEEMKTLPFGKTGSKDQVQIGRFVCDRYRGMFRTPALQTRADLGLWYASALGSSSNLVGEGDTPEHAVADLRSRAAAEVAKLTRVFLT